MKEVIQRKILEAEDRDWEVYKEAVTSAAAETLGSKKSYQGRKKTTPWWTEAVKSAVGEKMKVEFSSESG